MKKSYCVYLNDTSIKLFSFEVTESSHIQIDTMETLPLKYNLYKNFLAEGEKKATKEAMTALVQTFSKTQSNRTIICFKLNDIKCQNSWIDSDMSKKEIETVCNEEAELFLSTPGNHTLYKEPLSQKISASPHKYWMLYFPTKYFNKLELALIPTNSKNCAFSFVHKSLPFLIPNDSQPATLIEIEEKYTIISLVQAREFRSIKYFPIHHIHDAVFFIASELSLDIEKRPIYITGSLVKKAVLDSIRETVNKKITPIPLPSKVTLNFDGSYHEISSAVACILRDVEENQGSATIA